jgi:hypothetical protein
MTMNNDKSNKRNAGERRVEHLKPVTPFEVSKDRRELTINFLNHKPYTGKNTNGFNSVFDAGAKARNIKVRSAD